MYFLAGLLALTLALVTGLGEDDMWSRALGFFGWMIVVILVCMMAPIGA